MLLLTLTSLLSLIVAARLDTKATPAEGDEGHTRSSDMVAASAEMVSHYIGKGIINHVSADATANVTWMDKYSGQHISKRSFDYNGLDYAGVFICSEENYKGNCYWQQAGGGDYHPYPYTRSPSFGVDMNLQRALFQHNNCLYNQYTGIIWRSDSNLWGVETWWESRPTSHKCRHCIGCIYGNAPGWTIN